MEVRTSYFANYKNYDGYLRFSVAKFPPPNSYDINLFCLAPSMYLLQSYKDGKISEEEYTKEYLNQLDEFRKHIDVFVQNLKHSLKDDKIVLLCYEKNGFCHRHILADYLNKNYGFNITEL